jgi:large subunit ribosomal protein L23
MDIYHTIIRPLVTEKSTHQSQTKTKQHGGTYAFEVHGEATKPQIKDAVQKIYGVKVVDVRTMNREGKARRFRWRYGKKEHTKKAVVVVDPNSHIDLFQ